MTASPATVAPARTVACGYCHQRHTIAGVRACAATFHAARAGHKPATPAQPALADVKAGRYALVRDGVVKFYVIDRPEQGRWAGRVFVSVMASDEKHAIRNERERATILDLIALDPAEAVRRFGRELGKCGVCGRTLTDADSRAAGIGPICADKGW